MSRHSFAFAPQALDAATIVRLFNATFLETEQTCLRGGGEEPFYQPADGTGAVHSIIFTRDYAASALHEVAHWCVAGAQRRLLEDYGYWYAPDGRTAEQQALFERVEVRPQALEWLFSAAAGRDFHVSADNLSAGLGASEAFKEAIYQQVMAFCQQGVCVRPQRFMAALLAASGVAASHQELLLPTRFVRSQL